MALLVGPVAVRWYGLFALAGLVTAIWVAARDAPARGVSPQAVLQAALWTIPIAAVGARAVRVLSQWEHYLTAPGEIARLDPASLSFWGGLAIGGLAAARGLRDDPVGRLGFADAAATSLPVGIVLGQIGAFLDGSGQGTPTGLPWGTHYASPLANTPDFGIPRHPAQLYDALAALAILALVRALPSRLPAGTRWWTFLALYGAARVAFSPVRLDPPFLFGLQAEALIALAAAAFACVQLLQLGYRATIPARRHA